MKVNPLIALLSSDTSGLVGEHSVTNMVTPDISCAYGGTFCLLQNSD